MVYSREIDGKTFTFGVSGMLLKNSLIMFDYETKSLWPVMMNRAVRGKMAGTRLQELPVVEKTTWGEWKKAHPETKVLSVKTSKGWIEHDPHNAYAERFAAGKAGVRPIENVDHRLGAFERVIGIELEGESKAYAARRLQKDGVVQDEVGKVPVVVTATESSEAFWAFHRRLGDEVLRFSDKLVEGHLEDEGGSRWDPMTGVATHGPRKGDRLEWVPTKDVFWFIWADYHPKTGLY